MVTGSARLEGGGIAVCEKTFSSVVSGAYKDEPYGKASGPTLA